MEAKEFGRFIAGMRKEKKMTQAELAEKIHVTDKAVSRWERGLGFPDIQTIEPLAQALGISVLAGEGEGRGGAGNSVYSEGGGRNAAERR